MSAVKSDEEIVRVTTDGVELEGSLAGLGESTGLVLFAHGSGSSRFSPRNNFVAGVLRKAGLATLLIDLLTKDEDRDYELRFDIDLLAERLSGATTWVSTDRRTKDLLVGYFGASTGAAAALQSAALMKTRIGAIVSRGGRPDLADAYLGKVSSPTLLIVGGLDDAVIELNRHAYSRLKCEKKMVIVPGATHLFEEPGTLEEVAALAAEWFKKHLT